MPGKKKKEGKAKGGKDGEEGKLPPPPKLDDQRQGALEAFLQLKWAFDHVELICAAVWSCFGMMFSFPGSLVKKKW